jgi:hypothetical protein
MINRTVSQREQKKEKRNPKKGEIRKVLIAGLQGFSISIM